MTLGFPEKPKVEPHVILMTKELEVVDYIVMDQRAQNEGLSDSDIENLIDGTAFIEGDLDHETFVLATSWFPPREGGDEAVLTYEMNSDYLVLDADKHKRLYKKIRDFMVAAREDFISSASSHKVR